MIKIATPNDTRVLAELAIQMWCNHTVSELETDFAEIVRNNDAVCFVKYIDDISKSRWFSPCYAWLGRSPFCVLNCYICEEAMVERVIKCAEDTQNYYNEQDKAK